MRCKASIAGVVLFLCLGARAGHTADSVQLAFTGALPGYYPGEPINLHLEIQSNLPRTTADVYILAWIPGTASYFFFTENPDIPFSAVPLPFKSDIAVEPSSFPVLVTPALEFPDGLLLQFFGGLVPHGQPLVVEELISEIAQVLIKFIGRANDPREQSQAESARFLSYLSPPRSFSSRIVNGMVEELNLDVLIPFTGLPTSPTADDAAMFLINSAENLLRITDPTDNLRLLKRDGEIGQDETLTFRQYYHDIPVYGSWVQITVDADNPDGFLLKSIIGRYTPDLELVNCEPVISYQEAIDRVLETYRLKTALELRMLVPVKLWVYDDALFGTRCPQCEEKFHQPRLAWRAIISSPENSGASTDVFVDAVNGRILARHPRVYDIDIDIETANNSTSSTCWYLSTDDDAWFDEDGVCKYRWYCPFSDCCSNACADGWNCASPDQDGWDLYTNTWDNYYFYKTVFNRDSYDDDGGEFEMYAHVGPQNWHKAQSVSCSGLFMYHEFGDGMVVGDVVGHEVGHSFHLSEVNFAYSNQSGAIAEHIADVFGHFVGEWTGKDDDWLAGENSAAGKAKPCGAVRDMEDPTLCGHPDHFSNYVSTAKDNGGVHTNCSILNKADFLLTDGGAHHSILVSGIGEAKARQIYYWAVTAKLPSNPSFATFRKNMLDACNELKKQGKFGITANDCCQVQNALGAVGIGSADKDCDGTSDAKDPDDDGDGVPDSKDNCPLIPNPSQANHDTDKSGDACDLDDDNDGVPDHIVDNKDNCRTVPNPKQEDQDKDGIGDACEDSDKDGLMDSKDNCPNIWNPNQKDQDNDGDGDACDTDLDGDGIGNNQDNCPKIVNKTQTDTDGDKVGDACDNCIQVSNLTQKDLDKDGQGDACDDDWDGDGISNDEDDCPYEPEVMCLGELGQDSWKIGINWRNVLLDRPVLFLFDICSVIPCPKYTLFKPDDFLNMTLTVTLNIPPGAEIQQPVNITLGILDEAGYLLKKREVTFDTENMTQTVEFSFPMMPSFSWGDRNEADPQAAIPNYYMAVGPDVRHESVEAVLLEAPLEIRSGFFVGVPRK